MKGDSVLGLGHQTGPMGVSWLASCLLHGGLAVTAVFFVQRMQLAPQAEPFLWDVAMVAPLSHAGAFASPAESMTPSPPAPRRPVPSKPDVPPAVTTMQPSEVTQATSLPLAQTHKPVLEARHEQSPFTESNQQDSPPPLVTTVPSQIASQSLADSATPMNERLTGLTGSQTSADALLDSSSTTPTSIPLTQLASRKTDYGWLASLMAHWIEDLNKRYPATLRTEGVQGKVTLTAMLHEDGLLSDIRVVKSSGNPALDQVALEDVRNGPPVKFSRPLDRPQMSVKFSILYDLQSTR